MRELTTLLAHRMREFSTTAKNVRAFRNKLVIDYQPKSQQKKMRVLFSSISGDSKLKKDIFHGLRWMFHELIGTVYSDDNVLLETTEPSKISKLVHFDRSTLLLPRVINFKFACSLIRNITSHGKKNLACHSLLRWKMIFLPILTTSHIITLIWTWEWSL